MAMTNLTDHKSAFLIWTPFHLFGVIHFIVDKKLVGKTDAYIICQFPNADEIVKRVISSGIFSSVKCTHLDRIESAQKLWIFIGLFISPKMYVRHLFGRDIPSSNYENVYYSAPTRTNDIFVIANHSPKVYGVDDGIGSYLSDVFSVSLGKKYEFIKKALHKNYTVQAQYLFMPEFYNGVQNRTILNLISNNNSYSQASMFAHQIFKVDNVNNYITYHHIYLNQPVSDFPDITVQIEEEKTIFNIISSSLNRNLLVRLHPREKHSELYHTCTIDQFNPMWELICSDIIDESYSLIACFSTAQFTPKLLFNKEPVLIFTYPLYTNISNESKTRFSSMVSRLRDIYSHPEKIIVIDKLSDLSEVL